MTWHPLLLIIVLSALGGVALLFGAVTLYEEYRSWKYRLQHTRELLARPKVPYNIKRFEVQWYGEYGEWYWYAEALDKDGVKLDTDSGDHPIDAIANVLSLMEKKSCTPTTT
jgi:hypothetical protein